MVRHTYDGRGRLVAAEPVELAPLAVEMVCTFHTIRGSFFAPEHVIEASEEWDEEADGPSPLTVLLARNMETAAAGARLSHLPVPGGRKYTWRAIRKWMRPA